VGELLSCRWCPRDGSCHDPGSLLNPCSTSEQYVFGVNCPEFHAKDPSENWQIDRAYSDLFYSYAAYCNVDKIKKFDITKTKWGLQNPDFKLLGHSLSDELYAFVGYDARVGAIKIVFRGTDEHKVQNLLTDAHLTLVNCRYCGDTQVHAGFYNGFHTLLDAGLGDHIRDAISEYPNAPVQTTGHSLGGALAVLAALWVRHHLHFGGGSAMTGETVPISMYTYGQPRVGLAPFAKYLMEIDIEHFRVVNGADLVPHIPVARGVEGLSYRHTKVEAWFHTIDAPPTFSYEAESQKKTSSNSIADLHFTLSAHMHYLGYPEDHCKKVTCICPNGVPSREKCGGSHGNYETKCKSCFAPYKLGENGECTKDRGVDFDRIAVEL